MSPDEEAQTTAKTIQLRESNTDPRLFAPNDMTTLLASIGDEEVKRIRDSDVTIDLELCTAKREIMDSAVDC
jgi:hypothetical protein